jgi:hypothetical protein
MEEEMRVKRMTLNSGKCPSDCRKCKDYSPLGNDYCHRKLDSYTLEY